MGVITSIPKPIKIQLKDINATKSDYILDSAQYDNNPAFLRKAMKELANNKSIQKVVLKFFLPPDNKEDLSKSISNLLNTKSTLVIYGSNLFFFEHSKWVKIWSKAKLSNLQIKFELLPGGFDYLSQGLSSNKNLIILGFRYLNDQQLKLLGKTLSANPKIFHLQIVLEPRPYTLEIFEEGINSTKIPSTPQLGSPPSFLSQSKFLTIFTLGGYHDRGGFLNGITNNSSIETLILENIDIEKHLRHDCNTAFRQNSSIKEVRCIRGLNTLSALIIFQSLRKNNKISSLLLEESVFYDHGFLGLETYLKLANSLTILNIKNLLHLSINQFSNISSQKNLARILSGLAENHSLLEVYIVNHPASSLDVQKLEKIDGSLCEAFERFLSSNKTLKIFTLEYFRLGSESFPGIARGLSQNICLENLSLIGNLMSWDDLLCLTSELTQNTKLELLDLTTNNLFKDLTNIELRVFTSIFKNLRVCQTKTIKIEESFWTYKTYPFHESEDFDACRVKYS